MLRRFQTQQSQAEIEHMKYKKEHDERVALQENFKKLQNDDRVLREEIEQLKE